MSTATRLAEPWVDTEAVAEHLGVNAEYIYANADALGLPRVKIGRRWKYRISAIDAWLEGQMGASA